MRAQESSPAGRYASRAAAGSLTVVDSLDGNLERGRSRMYTLSPRDRVTWRAGCDSRHSCDRDGVSQRRSLRARSEKAARGRAKVDGQWHLHCLVHNREKLTHAGYAFRAPPAAPTVRPPDDRRVRAQSRRDQASAVPHASDRCRNQPFLQPQQQVQVAECPSRWSPSAFVARPFGEHVAFWVPFSISQIRVIDFSTRFLTSLAPRASAGADQ